MWAGLSMRDVMYCRCHCLGSRVDRPTIPTIAHPFQIRPPTTAELHFCHQTRVKQTHGHVVHPGCGVAAPELFTKRTFQFRPVALSPVQSTEERYEGGQAWSSKHAGLTSLVLDSFRLY